MHTLNIDNYAFHTARDAVSKPKQSFIYTQGLTGKGQSIDPFVSVGIHGAGSNGSPGLYAGLHLTPDEARGLAYRLLDAADEAQDAPIGYALTGKR